MHPNKPGRDHLGLGSVSSDQILPHLSPGINVLTFHPRYHSFYLFLLDEFWRRDRIRSWGEWIRFFRPRDFIFAAGACLCEQPEHTDDTVPVGAQKLKIFRRSPLGSYRYLEHTDYIKSELGGYGLYYRSVMAELGLIYPGGAAFLYPIDTPTEYGQEVAAAFRQGIQETRYYREYFDDDASQVPQAVIREYLDRACLCQLQTPSAPDRPLLLKAFLYGGNSALAANRRQTFQLVLDMANQTESGSITQAVFRQLLYFQATDTGIAYHPREALIPIYQHWRLYQAREYYAFALNILWNYLCVWGLSNGGDGQPLPLSLFWKHLEDDLDIDSFADRLGLSHPGLKAGSGFQHLLDWLCSLMQTNEKDFDLACTLLSPFHEHRLYLLAKEAPGDPRIVVAAMMILLCLVYLRFGNDAHQQQSAWKEVARRGEDGRLSLDEFIQAVRQQLQSGAPTLLDIARWLYQDYIIRQHLLVAERKLPENTYRFLWEGNKLRFYPLPNSVDFMDSRFDALSLTLTELGLCKALSQPHHPLTIDGKQFLEDGDLR
ncbi:MAG TPA: hypothetical protein VFV38_14625 [Ktedonobacteraceae bacterium]|nr:hypothetical protein [Ktedonobacteraceae bacterium]